jgi:hypothetical protein
LKLRSFLEKSFIYDQTISVPRPHANGFLSGRNALSIATITKFLLPIMAQNAYLSIVRLGAMSVSATGAAARPAFDPRERCAPRTGQLDRFRRSAV